MKFDPKKLLGTVQAFAIGVTVSALFAIENPWIQGILITLAILSLSLVCLYIVKELLKRKRYILQGENIDIKDYEAGGFGVMTDSEDETGQVLVNLRPNWWLVGRLELGDAGWYLANIRFKKIPKLDTGSFKFTIYNGGKDINSIQIDMKDLPSDEYTYKDINFYYDRKSDIKFKFAPDDNAKIKEVVGFDRIEAYLLPKGYITRE